MPTHGIDHVGLEGPLVLLLRPDLLQVFPLHFLAFRSIRDDHRLADELVVLHEVLVAGAVEVDRLQHEASAREFRRKVLRDGLTSEALDANAGGAADVAAEVRHLDYIGRHARLCGDDVLPYGGQVGGPPRLLDGRPAADARRARSRRTSGCVSS